MIKTYFLLGMFLAASAFASAGRIIYGSSIQTEDLSKTYNLPAAADTLVGRASTDTLTNKTLTSPVISSISNTGTLTLPTSTDTLVGRATTDTLTNKSISGSTNTLSNIPADTALVNVLGTSHVSSARTINAQTGTTYTLVLGDGANAGGHPLITQSNASAITTTVPTNASVAFPVGDQVEVCQIGAGKVTFAAAGGVTINSLSGNLAIGGQYVCVSLIKTATNTWLLVGNLIP